MNFRPEDVKPGQEVCLRTGRSHAPFSFGFEVVRVTPSGQVVLKSTSADGSAARAGAEFRFDRRGGEMGLSSYSQRWIETDVAGARACAEIDRLRAVAARATNEIKRGNEMTVGVLYDTDTMKRHLDALRRLLCEAEVAVEFLRLAEAAEAERKAAAEVAKVAP